MGGTPFPATRAHRARRQLPIGQIPLILLATVLACTAPPALARQDEVRQARLRHENRREAQQRTAEIVVALGAVAGAHVADVGAGDGFFTVRLARAVGPQGLVIAEDIDREALDRLRARVAEELLTNVEVVLGQPDDPRLPDATLDAVLIVNAYHEMGPFQAVLAHVRRALKQDGRLVLLEPFDPKLRGESRAKQTKAHSLAPAFAEEELRAAGFDVAALRDPFVRGQEEQWLMVARPEPPAVAGAIAQQRELASAAVSSGELPNADAPGTEATLASPELRISEEQLAALVAADAVLVLDVRDADSYVAGHIPGARLVPLSDLADHLGPLVQETRPIVAYCT
jgi:ubiquinone/menaquinone biosynthesis C-methylase UbiE